MRLPGAAGRRPRADLLADRRRERLPRGHELAAHRDAAMDARRPRPAGPSSRATWLAISGDPLPPLATLVDATLAGFGLMIALLAFFQAMVIGTISIVAPISATGVVIPIVAGLVRGDRPSAAQIAGIAAGVVGVALASRVPGERRRPGDESGLGLALVAALGGGVFFWLMAPASRHGVGLAGVPRAGDPGCGADDVVRASEARGCVPAFGGRTALLVVASALLAFVATAAYAVRDAARPARDRVGARLALSGGHRAARHPRARRAGARRPNGRRRRGARRRRAAVDRIAGYARDSGERNSSSVRPLSTERGCSATMSMPGRASSSRRLTSSHCGFSPARVRWSAKPPRSFSPCSTKTAWPRASASGQATRPPCS